MDQSLPRARRAAAVARVGLALGGLLASTSCGPSVDGTIGITVDRNGQFLGIVASCDRPVNDVVLSSEFGKFRGDLGSWDLRGDSTRAPVAWPLSLQESSTSTRRTPLRFSPHGEMTLVGEAQDASEPELNASLTGLLIFHRGDLRKIQHPGQVLVSATEPEGPTVVSRGAFEKSAC